MKQWLNKNIMGFSLASLLSDICYEMTTPLLPSFLAPLVRPQLVPTVLGAIQGIADASATVMKLWAGWVADRAARYKFLLVLGYGITGTFIPLIGIARSAWGVFIYKTIAWMSRGFRDPIRDTWMAKIVPSKFYGRAYGLQRAFDTMGSLIGPLAAYILLQHAVNTRIIFLLAFIPGILSVLPIVWLTSEQREQKPSAQKITFFSQLKNLPARFNYFAMVMVIFGIAHFNQALIIYRVQEVFSGKATTSILATGWAILFYLWSNVAKAFGEAGIGTLSDYSNRRLLLAIAGMGFWAIANIGFMFQSKAWWYWIIFFGLAGLSAGTVRALEKAHAAQLLHGQHEGIGLGIINTIEGIGGLVSSLVIGLLWSLFGPTISFLYAAILSFIAMILLLIQKD